MSKKFTIKFTRHAIQRILERCGKIEEIKRYLKKRQILLSKRAKEYEIVVPGGRLIGVMENKEFVVKTFLFPWRTAKDYNSFGRHSTKGLEGFCREIIFVEEGA